MTQLELSTEERTTLADVLESYLSDLSYEISNTDSLDYRNGLKDKAAILRKILSELQA